MAVDRSGSTAAMREALKRYVAQGYNEALDRQQPLSVWAVDREAVCLYGPRLSDEDRLPPEVYQALEVGAAPATATRTRPALFWEAMVTRVPKNPGVTRILYLTDGGNDFAGDLPRIQTAAKQLAASPQVFVTIAGVQPDQRAWLEAAFAPLADRFQIGSRGEEMSALGDWVKQGS